MALQIFKGQGRIDAAADLDRLLPQLDRTGQRAPEHYVADEDLRQAVDVALYPGMPLLLTGEPGTGKTQLAYRVAAEFGLGEPLVFDTKSSSVAQDLFYNFDAVRRFAVAQTHGRVPAVAATATATATATRRAHPAPTAPPSSTRGASSAIRRWGWPSCAPTRPRSPSAGCRRAKRWPASGRVVQWC